MLRDTDYATEIVTVDIGGQRIERIFVKEKGEAEIRFSYWPKGRMAQRPLDLPERELLELIKEAILRGAFTEDFLKDLHTVLRETSNVGKRA